MYITHMRGYSRVLNKCTGTFINFQAFFQGAWPLFCTIYLVKYLISQVLMKITTIFCRDFPFFTMFSKNFLLSLSFLDVRLNFLGGMFIVFDKSSRGYVYSRRYVYFVLQSNLIYSKLPWLKKGHLVNIPKPWRCLDFKKLLLAGLFSTSVTQKNQITLGTFFLTVRQIITSTKDYFRGPWSLTHQRHGISFAIFLLILT